MVIMAFICLPVFSQHNASDAKPTKAQKKAQKARLQQEKRAQKAIHEGKKRHYQLQDKKTRKRMKKNRRKVDKYSPGKPRSFFYRKQPARCRQVSACLFHAVMPAGSSLQIPSDAHHNKNGIGQHRSKKVPGIAVQRSSFQIKEQNRKYKADSQRNCCQQCSSSVGHKKHVMLRKIKARSITLFSSLLQ
jgi:hypothetical protein